jgi:hypothetical protein
MGDIAIYRAEQELGLTDLIRSTARVAFAGLAMPDHQRPLPARLSYALATNIGQMDLYYLKSVLVSTGINKNDDFFENVETWLARATPEDKPFNYEHDQDDIIGHITDCRVVGADGKEISDDTPVDGLPSKFHILTAAVLYRQCGATERQQRTDRIIAELPQNKWFVSMEALFRGFDYVLVPQGGGVSQARVVARNEQTAFLTKYLRAYGGTGVYKDCRVGRVLRNITFAGKGLVRNPANPESVILTTDDQPGEGAVAKISQFSEVAGYLKDSLATQDTEQESNTVANETVALEGLQKQVADLTAKNKELNDALTAAQAANWEKQVATLKDELKAAQDAAKAGTEKVAALETQVKETEAKLTETVEAKTKAEQALATIESERKFAARLAKVSAAYKVEGDEAKEIAETLTALTDEAFEKHVTKVAAKVSSLPLGDSNVSGLPKPMAGEPKEVKVAGGPTGGVPPVAPATVTASEDEEPAPGAENALANATPTDAPGAIPTETAEAGVEELQADIMRYWGLKAEAAE